MQQQSFLLGADFDYQGKFPNVSFLEEQQGSQWLKHCLKDSCLAFFTKGEELFKNTSSLCNAPSKRKKQSKSYQTIKEWYENDEQELKPFLFSTEELAQ